MRKIRNLVIGGIESKVVNLLLITMLLVAALFLASMITQSNILTSLTNETSDRQLAAMTETTASVMDTVIVESMDRITWLEALLTDEVFNRLSMQVQLVGDYAQKLLSDPDGAPRVPWARPDASHNGELFAKVLLADGLEESAVADRLGLIANMAEPMRSICGRLGADNAWFTLPEGITLMADKLPGNWIAEDGSYISYNAPDRYWYRQAVETGELVFSDVEFDHRTGELCVTCALPVYGADGQLLGVAGADMYMDDMQQAVYDAAQSRGFLVVVNTSGHVIMSPEDQGVFSISNSAEAEDLRDSDIPELAALVSDAMRGKTDVRRVPLPDGNYYMIGVPMETVGWTLLAAFSETDAEQPVRQLRADFQSIQQEVSDAYSGKISKAKTVMWGLLFALLAVMLIVSIIIGKRIVKPLNTITRRISELSETNLEFKMEDEYRTGDEVEALAESFAMLSAKTLQYVEEVKSVTAEKERIGAELSMATDIQASQLPRLFPAFPNRPEFDLYASMDPAKEVGGDFYDFFMVDDDHVAMLIADVSGKGVPAALFMMISRILLKSHLQNGESPAEALSRVNNQLCEGNEAEFFVTVWVAVLDYHTGKGIAANAGHEHPALKHAGGEYSLVVYRHAPALGLMEGIPFREHDFSLNPGDNIFVYTDGVPEATNAENELFGPDRMLDALNENPNADPEQTLAIVRRHVDEFVGEAEQFDDLTMLCFTYKGPQDDQTS